MPRAAFPLELQLVDASTQLATAELAELRMLAAKAITHALAGLPRPEGVSRHDVRVRVINDAAMAFAHERFSNVPGTTDVLTFDLAEGAAADGSEPLDVDVLICVDEARRQAGQRGHTVVHELLLYVLHAVLHCLGEDDHDDHAYQLMHAREDAILNAMGIGPLFHADRSSPEGR